MPRYWFRQKQYGYGATPNSWQGWVFVIAIGLLMAGLIFGADFVRKDGPRLLLILVGMPLILIPALLITHAKTEGGWHWHWGEKRFGASGERPDD